MTRPLFNEPEPEPEPDYCLCPACGSVALVDDWQCMGVEDWDKLLCPDCLSEVEPECVEVDALAGGGI